MLNSKKWPGAFLLTVLMVVLFEAGNYIFDDYFYLKYSGFRLKHNNELSLRRGNDFNIIVLGECDSASGMMPSIIEKKTGLTCHNFASYWVQTYLASYCVLNNYLKKCAKKPRYILIGHDTTLNDKIARDNYYDMSKGNSAIFIKEFGIFNTLKLYVPSLKHHGFFNKMIDDPGLFKNLIYSKSRIDNFNKRFEEDKGYDLLDPGIWDGDFPAFIKERKKSLAVLSPSHDKYVRAILSLARDNNIKVIWSITPRPVAAGIFEEEQGISTRYYNYIGRLKKEYDNLIVLQLSQDILYENKHFIDGVHLTKEGGKLYSEFISEKINEINKQ